MGGGYYDADTSRADASLRRTKGIDDFATSARIASAPPSARKADDAVDPLIKAGPTSPFAGKVMRESRDSDDHPTSLAVIIGFDVTGSMSTVPRRLVTKLADLFPMIIRKGYIEHPHVMFAAVGDARHDRVPFQFGQFEADNRCEEQLMKMYLERGGGADNPPTESYETFIWWLATHTSIDCWDKRGQKGYVFIIGDEGLCPVVDPYVVKKFFDEDLGQPVTVEEAVKMLQERYHVFLIRPAGSSYRPGDHYGERIIEQWAGLLGPQNVIDLPDDRDKDGNTIPATDLVCETIAVTIGLMEGVLDSVDDGLHDLADAGSTVTGAGLSKALALVGSGTGGGGLATSAAPGGLDLGSGTETL